MYIHSFALVVFYASLVSSANGFWWWRPTETVTCTVTSTQTIQTCTTTCSAFGARQCSSVVSSSQRSTTIRTSSTISLTTSSTTSLRTSSTTSLRTSSTASLRTSSTTSLRTSSTTSLRTSSTYKPSTTSSRPASSSTPVTTHATTSSSPSPPTSSTHTALPSAHAFFIRANSPAQLEANGQYAVVSGEGFLQFGTANPANASQFTLSASGQLLYNLKPATIDPSLPAAAVQFATGSTKLKGKRAGSASVACVVTADTNGAALLECAADASTIQQACGIGFYLGSTLQCQPLTLTSVTPGSTAETTNPPTSPSLLNPFPGQSFSLQANGPPIVSTYQGGYAVYFTTGGITELVFANYIHGAAFSLDTDGHLIGINQCPPGATGCTGNVAYAATFKIGDTLGPIAMMYGEVAAGYTPIVCQIPPGVNTGDGAIYSITCQDGANGANNVIQQCQSDVFYLGTTLGTNCKAATVLVKYSS